MGRSVVSLAVVFLVVTGAEAVASSAIPGLRVLSVDASGVSVEYRLGEFSLEPVSTPEGQMTRVRISGFGMLSDDGKPALPVAGVWVALPPTGSFTLRILEQETETLTGVDVAPADRVILPRDGVASGEPGREYHRDHGAYAAGDPYPGVSAAIEDVSWLRFQRVAALRLYPVRYVPATRALLISRRLVLRVDFEAGKLSPRALEAAGLEAAPELDGRFERIYAGALLNYEQGRAYRARPSRISGSSVGEPTLGTGNLEWKVRIDTTGVWRVRFDQLRAHGWPEGISVDAITAFRRDTTADLAPAAWIARDVPIDVVDMDGDQVFDDEDFVVLLARTWAERASPTWYERRHGDAEVLWLSYKSEGLGLRVRTRPGWLDAPGPAIPASFESVRRYERGLEYDAVPLDVTVTDQFLWTNEVADEQPIDFQADLLDLDAAGTDITVRAEWVGRRNIQHKVSASWVNGVAGVTPLWTDLTFFGKGALDHQQTFPASAASPGVNSLRISGNSGLPNDPSGSRASFNWFEVSYPRFYVARNNHLEFTNGGVEGTVELRLDGYVAATRPTAYAYDVTDWNDPVRLLVGPDQVVSHGGAWRVLLQDVISAGGTRRYSASSEIPTVPDEAVSAGVASRLYRTPAHKADLVIIVHDDWADAMEPLAAFRRSQGVSTLVAKAQDVYDEFNGGRKSHFAIRRFLRYALSQWNTRSVLLVGDASEDPQGLLGTGGPDFVPAPVIPSPVTVFDGFSNVSEVVPSDNWYVFGLTGPPGPGDDLLADMLIGRWTVGSASEAQAVVDKAISSETAGAAESWKARAVLIADDTYSTSATFGGGGTSYCPRPHEGMFEDISQNVDAIIRQEGGYSNFDVRPFYLADYLTGLPMAPGCTDSTRESWPQTQLYTRAAVSPVLFQLLSEGAAFVNFQGHGNPFVLTHEDLYISRGANQDIDLISNAGKPWVFTGFSSHLNNYASVREGNPPIGDGLGERMVNAAERGAVASFASTAFEVFPSSTDNNLNIHLYRAIFADPPPGAGAGSVPFALGDATTLAVINMLATSFFPYERGAARTYVLLGDPLLSVSPSRTVDVPEVPTSMLRPSLGPGRPNPARGSMRFAFSLPVPVHRARLALYDVGGRLVRVLLDKPLDSGNHEGLWDGRIEGGQAASPGVYFCRLDLSGPQGRQVLARRVVHLR